METFDEVLKRLSRWCAERERSPIELHQKMKEFDISDDDKNRIQEILTRDDFINERRFALAYAGGKFRINKWGKMMIRQGLHNKGIKGDVMEEALASIDPGDYSRMLDKLLADKARSIKGLKEYERNNRLVRFAYSKGYSQEEAYDSIKRLEL